MQGQIQIIDRILQNGWKQSQVRNTESADSTSLLFRSKPKSQDILVFVIKQNAGKRLSCCCFKCLEKPWSNFTMFGKVLVKFHRLCSFWSNSHFIFVTTITTTGCVKYSVKCKISNGYVKETALILHKMCSFTKSV